MLARKALAGTAAAPKVYVEDVFSTYLYTGTGSAQTFTNNIDLSTKGGLVWIKGRSGTTGHRLTDTARGVTKSLASNDALAEATESTGLTAFGTTGFTIGADADYNTNAATYASWTFREAEKFFDVVTYSGNSVDNRAISHNLGSTPGCVIVRRRSGDDWFVYHRSLSANNGLRLNKNDAASSNTATVKSVSSTTFTVGTDGMVNVSGSDYVAYLFAHDAGGFGDSGSDNIITCGSFTTNGSGAATVSLGYEPQWAMFKNISASQDWFMSDSMRGMPVGYADPYFFTNLTNAEATYEYISPTATGFNIVDQNASNTYIYIAIRRGPMKTPEDATKVFTPVAGTTNAPTFKPGHVTDSVIALYRPGDAVYAQTWDRLRGEFYLKTASTGAEVDDNRSWDYMNGAGNFSGDSNYLGLCFRRAPGFFDVVCYTGDGNSGRNVSHNLGVVPEMMIAKSRSGSFNWYVYHSALGNSQSVILNATNAVFADTGTWSATTPTSSVFTVGSSIISNASGYTQVMYLFATLPGVSKVGTYTGNGSSVTVTTNFQPRFILVKRTDSTGDWIVSDSVRGLVAGNDPYSKLNTTDAEVTNEDWVDISSTSFTVNQTTNNANVNTGTYIYLAIA